MSDIVYFDFIGELFNPCVAVVFSFRLSPVFRVEIELVSHVFFSVLYLFCCFSFSPISEVG